MDVGRIVLSPQPHYVFKPNNYKYNGEVDDEEPQPARRRVHDIVNYGELWDMAEKKEKLYLVDRTIGNKK